MRYTLFEDTRRPIPIGKNTIPMKKNTGRTDDAVKIGCQALSFCCLNAESAKKIWVEAKLWDFVSEFDVLFDRGISHLLTPWSLWLFLWFICVSKSIFRWSWPWINGRHVHVSVSVFPSQKTSSPSTCSRCTDTRRTRIKRGLVMFHVYISHGVRVFVLLPLN